MNRRGFLGAILALSAAPAIVRADSLMKIRGLEPEWFDSQGVRFMLASSSLQRAIDTAQMAGVSTIVLKPGEIYRAPTQLSMFSGLCLSGYGAKIIADHDDAILYMPYMKDSSHQSKVEGIHFQGRGSNSILKVGRLD